MMTDVGTSASAYFGIVNVRTATGHEGHFVGGNWKMTVLAQTAFTSVGEVAA